MNIYIKAALLFLLAFLLSSEDLFSQRRGGGGRGGGGFRGAGMSRGGARTSVTARPRPASRPSVSRPASRPSVSRPATRPSVGPATRPSTRPSVSQPIANRPGVDRTRTDIGSGTANRNTNRVVDRNREVNINRDLGGDYDLDYDGCCNHPIAAGVIVGATAAAVAGSYAYPYYGDPYAYGDTYIYYEDPDAYTIPYTDPAYCAAEVVNGVTYQNCNGTWYLPQFSGTDITYVTVSSPR